MDYAAMNPIDTTGADDIDKIFGEFDQIIVQKVFKQLQTGNKKKDDILWAVTCEAARAIREHKPTILNLLETERERVLDMVEAEAMYCRCPQCEGAHLFKAVPVEVIERLRGASSRSLRSVNSSPETNLNNNAPGVEEK